MDRIQLKELTLGAEEEALPELTADAEELVDEAWGPGPPQEKLVEEFGIPITRHDIRRLKGLEWLNDEVNPRLSSSLFSCAIDDAVVLACSLSLLCASIIGGAVLVLIRHVLRVSVQVINFYMKLIGERHSKDSSLPRVHCHNTFFYEKLTDNGFDKVKRWTRRVCTGSDRHCFIVCLSAAQHPVLQAQKQLTHTIPTVCRLTSSRWTTCLCLCTWARTGAWPWWTSPTRPSSTTTP